MAKISFVMPTKNRGDRIEKSISSIIAQTEKNWELIVVDDHSDTNDKTECVIKKIDDQRIHYVRMPDRWSGGIPNARNFGNQFASAPYIAIADSDDLSSPNRAKLTLEAFKKSGADIVFGKYQVFFENDNRTVASEVIIKNFVSDQLKDKNYISNNSSAYKRELAYQFPYNSFFVMAEDYDFFTRLAEAGKNFYYIDEVLFTYVIHSKNISGGKALLDLESLIKANRGWIDANCKQLLIKILK